MMPCNEVAEYWDLVPAIVGGIIGAFAGGVPAWLLAKRQSDETLKRNNEQRVETEKALAFSAGVKLLNIATSIVSLNNHVKMCMAIRQQPGSENMQPWQVLFPQIGHTDEAEVRFSPEEMAIFVKAQEHAYMLDLMLLAQRNAASLEGFRQYCIMRKEFQPIGPKPAIFNGQIGSAWVTAEQEESLKQYTIPLNNVAEGLEAGLEKDVSLARTVTERFDAITSKYFGVEKFMTISLFSDEELAAMQVLPNNIKAGAI